MRFRDYDIAKEFQKRGWNVTIIAASYSHLRQKNPSCKSEVIDGIYYHWIKVPKYKNLGIQRILNMMLFTFNLYFRKLTLEFEPDFIIASSPSPFTVLNGVHLKKKYKAKFIYEIRDIWPLSIIELKGSNRNHPLVLLFDWIDKLGLKNANAVLSPLGQISKYINDRGFKKKVIIVPNGISTTEIELKDKKRSGESFVVGYGGSLSDSNSIMNLVLAARLLKDVDIEFKIAGTGERYHDIQELIKSENLKNVKLMGQVPKKDFLTLMDSCDILYKGNPRMNLYKYGVSSIKMVEYLLLKKPIIDASYGVDIVQKSGAGIVVEPENSEALAEGILRLKIMTSAQREKIGNDGFEYVKRNFHYENTVGKMIRELDLICKVRN